MFIFHNFGRLQRYVSAVSPSQVIALRAEGLKALRHGGELREPWLRGIRGAFFSPLHVEGAPEGGGKAPDPLECHL